MWRIKTLTEVFGVWNWLDYTVDKMANNGADGAITTNVLISLFIKVDGEWSKPIVGLGGE